MWFSFSRPDYLYFGRYRLLDAGDRSAFNRGWSQGFGFFVLNVRWNEGRSVSSDGLHYADHPRFGVTLNGGWLPLHREAVSYEDIVMLAGERHGATVTFWHRDDDTSGSLRPGQKILVTEGMVFNAFMTGNA